jgi:hypothetical protein
MLTLLFLLACSADDPPQLPEVAVSARRTLAVELQTRVPKKVSRAAEHAAQWEGLDSDLDRLLGDALANVLMNPADGIQLLASNPAPADAQWVSAYLAAASRTGDSDQMKKAWLAVGRPALDFSHPVTGQVRHQMLADPSVGADQMEAALLACALLDAQPPVGRKDLDHPVSKVLVDVAEALGATQVAVARPIFRTDPDPQTGRGPLQCRKKIWLKDGWPEPFPRSLTVAITDGVNKLFVDVRLSEGEPWAFAASDPIAGGRWLQAMKLWETPNGPERVREKYSEGLWANPSEARKR